MKENYIANWIKGAVDGVNDKMSEEKRLARMETGMMALMLGNDNSLAEYMAANYPQLGRSHVSTGGSSGAGYSQGHDAGRGIGVRQGIGGSMKRIG